MSESSRAQGRTARAACPSVDGLQSAPRRRARGQATDRASRVAFEAADGVRGLVSLQRRYDAVRESVTVGVDGASRQGVPRVRIRPWWYAVLHTTVDLVRYENDVAVTNGEGGRAEAKVAASAQGKTHDGRRRVQIHRFVVMHADRVASIDVAMQHHVVQHRKLMASAQIVEYVLHPLWHESGREGIAHAGRGARIAVPKRTVEWKEATRVVPSKPQRVAPDDARFAKYLGDSARRRGCEALFDERS